MNIRFIIQIFVPLLLVLMVNLMLPITFTTYFILCAVALLLSIFWNSRYACWSLITTASVAVTLNYLRPSADVYNNVAHNIIALRGIEKQGDISLVNSNNPSNALNDADNINGVLTAYLEENGVSLYENLSSHPVYVFDKSIGEGGSYSCINTGNLIKTTQSVKFECQGQYIELTLKNDKDTASYDVTFCTDTLRTTIASFNKKIKVGYPLVDVIRSTGNCRPQEERILSYLKDASIVKDVLSKDRISENVWYITQPKPLYDACQSGRIKIISDGRIYNQRLSGDSHSIPFDAKIYWGIGAAKSRVVSFNKKSIGGQEWLVMNYDMPIMYNFPVDSLSCSNKIASISSSSNALLSSEIKEAFYFNLFEDENNDYHFNGTISYQTAASPAPLTVNILDANQGEGKKVIARTSDSNHFQLLSKSGKAKWNISIVDLRKNSPITESPNPFTNEGLIIGIVLFVCIFTFITMPIFANEDCGFTKASAIFNVWCFFIPMITMRLYLLWRIATFPPVTNISKAEFLRYRMENSFSQNAMVITLFCIILLAFLTIAVWVYEAKLKEKVHFSISEKQATWGYYGMLALGITSLFSGLVLGNIMVPVIIFFVNEYLCLKYLKLPYRIANIIVVTGLLAKGDPGYAMMFIIFASVYYIIQTIIFRHSDNTDRAHRNAAWHLCILLLIATVLIIWFAPNIVSLLFSDKSILGLNCAICIIGFALILASIVIVRIIFIYYGRKAARVSTIIAICLIPFISIALPYFLNSNKHIKYRSLIHTQDVGQIMMYENVADHDNQRLLEASQNQWFLQYHSNLGEDRIFDSGIMHLYPHFKKGVSWNTQISDVICSRYIISELSLIVPLAIILFVFIFFLFSIRQKSESPIGKSISYGVALLLLIQTTFVWMANTNRMIFFGQDFPFMSQNARVTMLMFCLLLFFMMLASGNVEEDECIQEDELTNSGFDYFNRKPIKIFVVLFIAVFGVIFAFGNKYSALYHTSKATAFSVGQAMEQAEKDLELINAHLATYTAKKKLKPSGENLTELFADIENEIGMDSYVNELDTLGEIQPFSASLYKAFRNNLQTDNRVENIIHLQYISASNSYKFALNDGFYSLRAPEMRKMLWEGNVYAYDDKHDVNKIKVTSNDADKIDIYRVPRLWLKDDRKDVGIADVRYTSNKCKMVLRSPKSDYEISAGIFVLNQDECIESRIGENIYLDQLPGRNEKLLAKNMVVNGVNKFFYPLGKSFFWIKDFSELLAGQSHGDRYVNCELTIDKDLLNTIYDDLSEVKKTCSVLALDGNGNVRLMAEYNERREYNLDPNNTYDIENFIEQSYLNPNYSEESKVFGNQNLIYMLPGPGSSLKPITYAAVTSQTSSIDWSGLKLHAPDSKNLSNDSRYYLMQEFGPDYKYSINSPFKSISGDEIGIDGWVDNMFYLYKSSNYYNALITYLGNYDKGDFKSLYDLLEPATDYSKYPTFELDGHTYNFKKSPSKNRQNSILNNGLAMNFKMNVALDDKDSTRFISQRWMSSAKVFNHPWVFPASSNAYMTQMKDLSDEALRLKQYTLGASPLRITPLMMAEMYGRLFSLHPDYYACITKNESVMREQWDTPSGMSQTDMFRFYQTNLFRGMYLCANNPNGTAYRHLAKVNRRGGSYVLYAKTGTLALGHNLKDDRMLAVIIANADVTTATSPSDYKFYVVYFRFKQTGDMYNISKIINHIINSKSFDSYMKS